MYSHDWHLDAVGSEQSSIQRALKTKLGEQMKARESQATLDERRKFRPFSPLTLTGHASFQ